MEEPYSLLMSCNILLFTVYIVESNRILIVPDTDSLGISETINPTKKMFKE